MTTAIASRTNTFFDQQVFVQNTHACPLCRESHAAGVATHLRRGEEGLGECTCEMIKFLYPEWVEEDGSCSSCWRFYSNLIRVLNVSGGFDARFQTGGWKDGLTRELLAN